MSNVCFLATQGRHFIITLSESSIQFWTVSHPGRAAVTFFVSSVNLNFLNETLQMFSAEDSLTFAWIFWQHFKNSLKTLNLFIQPRSLLCSETPCSSVSPCKIYISISATGPGRRSPAKGGTEIAKTERESERAREGKRFQDISSLRLEGVLEMRCGGGGGVGWDEEVGSDSQVNPASCLTSSRLLLRPQVTLFPIQ